jgi:hypothetical protein
MSSMSLAPYAAPLSRINSLLNRPLNAEVLAKYMDLEDLAYAEALGGAPSKESSGVVLRSDYPLKGGGWCVQSTEAAVALALKLSQPRNRALLRLNQNPKFPEVLDISLGDPQSDTADEFWVDPLEWAPRDLHGRRRVENALGGLREGDEERWIKALNSLGLPSVKYIATPATMSQSSRATPIRTPQNLAQSLKKALSESGAQAPPLNRVQELLARLGGVRDWQQLVSPHDGPLGLRFAAFSPFKLPAFECLADAIWDFVRKDCIVKSDVEVSFDNGTLRLSDAAGYFNLRAPRIAGQVSDAMHARAATALKAHQRKQALWLKDALANRAKRTQAAENWVFGPWEFVRLVHPRPAQLQIINLEQQQTWRCAATKVGLRLSISVLPRGLWITVPGRIEDPLQLPELDAAHIGDLVRYLRPIVKDIEPALLKLLDVPASQPTAARIAAEAWLNQETQG